VPALKPGAGVVTTRGHVHWVATEYGAVNLFGKSLRERAEALISIAHPESVGSSGARLPKPAKSCCRTHRCSEWVAAVEARLLLRGPKD